MKRLCSVLLAAVLLLSTLAGLNFTALAGERNLWFDDKTQGNCRYVKVSEEDYETPINELVEQKHGIAAGTVHIILGYYRTDSTEKYIKDIDSLREAGFSVDGEILIDTVWGEGDNYDAEWLGDYESTAEYHIGTAAELAAFKKACFIDGNTFEGKTVFLDNDIDIGGHYWLINGIALGESHATFSGVFDGCGNTVKNLKMYPVGGPAAAGLIPCVKNGAVKNLTVRGGAIRSNIHFLGLVSGYAADSAFYNCYAEGSLECVGRDRNYDPGSTGGLIGEAQHCAVINCGANTKLSLDYENVVSNNYSGGIPRFGGLIGQATTKVNEPFCVINCYSLGSINIKSEQFNTPKVGGLIGVADDDIFNCYSAVNFINEQPYYGALFGELNAENIVTDNSNNTTQNLGQYIISNNFYEQGKTPYGRLSNNTEGRNEAYFAQEYESPTWLLTMLNDGTGTVDRIISAHRDVLSDSSWADLLEQCGADDISAARWELGILSNMPEHQADLQHTHRYVTSYIEPTVDRNGYEVRVCRECGDTVVTEIPNTRIILTGWQQLDGKWYYFNQNGIRVAGWVKDGGSWYFLSSDGVMQTGWVYSNGNWYYLKASGAMATGWQHVGGKWYYLKANGAMATGWLKDGGKWYYLNTSGAMRTADLTYKGKVYKFNSSGACLNP